MAAVDEPAKNRLYWRLMSLPEITDTGSLGVFYLKRYWARMAQSRNGKTAGGGNWVREKTLLCGLGLGLHETMQFVNESSPSLAELERWILERNGGSLDPARVARLNAALTGQDASDPEIEQAADALTAQDLAFWDEHGYVILHDAVPPGNCRAAEEAVWQSIRGDPRDSSTWYKRRQDATIWLPLIHHPALNANRQSLHIRKAFAQLWGRNDIWITVDKAGFNPPETERWKFPGPHLHWDVSLAPPVPFGLQGILYLTDTAADQGAFRCVPGFHRKLNDWLRGLPPETNPRGQNLESLGAVPIAGLAGDLIVWRQELPHGSSPNRTAKPRIVQYISGEPSEWEINPVWL
jgi:Phytanoyl-CoA dioxygenase (PhyH)